MRSAFLCAAALCCCSAASAQERLVESAHVIYREATDDYLFRVRFAHSLDDPLLADLVVSFKPIGPRPIDGIHTVLGNVWESLGDSQPGVVSRSLPPPSLVVDRFDSIVEGNAISFVIPHSVMMEVGPLDTLFHYNFHASASEMSHSSNVSRPPIVALNVPEPSTLAIAAGIVLWAGPRALRALRRRRPPGR